VFRLVFKEDWKIETGAVVVSLRLLDKWGEVAVKGLREIF
jgi:hypothetical protein